MWSTWSAEERMITASLYLLTMLLLMQPRLLLALIAARSLLAPFLPFCPPGLPGPLPDWGAALLKSWRVPLQEVIPSHVWDFAFLLYEFHQVPCWLVSLTGRGALLSVINCSLQFSFIGKLKGAFVPFYRSLVKLLNRTSPWIGSWGTLLVAGLLVECKPLAATLSAWWSSQVFAHLLALPSMP